MDIEKIKAKVDVPFIHFVLPSFSDYRKDIIDSIEKEAVPNSFEKNFTNSLRTPWHIIKYDSIKWLADQVTGAIGQYDNCKEGSLVCNEIWGIISQSKTNYKSHNHYPATWSAVIYIDCPEGSGSTVWPAVDKKVKPIDGHVCIFPGWLNHYVEPTSDNTRRIIVSCNVYSRKQVQ